MSKYSHKKSSYVTVTYVKQLIINFMKDNLTMKRPEKYDLNSHPSPIITSLFSRVSKVETRNVQYGRKLSREKYNHEITVPGRALRSAKLIKKNNREKNQMKFRVILISCV